MAHQSLIYTDTVEGYRLALYSVIALCMLHLLYTVGNVLWAVYQFIVFIVLLSVLRARMVNTYHRIFRRDHLCFSKNLLQISTPSHSVLFHCQLHHWKISGAFPEVIVNLQN